MIRGIQLNILRTPFLRVLLIVGLVAALVARRFSQLVLLLAVSPYYLLFQSLLHTEYRYILPMHYFVFLFAALGIFELEAFESCTPEIGLKTDLI